MSQKFCCFRFESNCNGKWNEENSVILTGNYQSIYVSNICQPWTSIPFVMLVLRAKNVSSLFYVVQKCTVQPLETKHIVNVYTMPVNVHTHIIHTVSSVSDASKYLTLQIFGIWLGFSLVEIKASWTSHQVKLLDEFKRKNETIVK